MIYTASRDYGGKRKSITLSHRNFTFGETSLVIDKLHFPPENFTCNANFTIDSGFHPSMTDFIAKPLLRLRGFLHAFHLVEMTIPPPKKNVISSVVERSPSLWYEQWRKTKCFIVLP